MRHKPRYVLEYWCLRAVAILVGLLPYRCALALGWGLAAIGFCLVRFRVKIAKRRIREIFGPLPDARVRRIAWLSWRNFVFSAMELLRIPAMRPGWLDRVVEEQGIGKITEHLRSGRGAIIATVHMGSWEMAAMACLNYKIPLFSIAARQKNSLVDDYMNRLRAQTGFETVLREANVAKGIIRRIRAGKVLAILPDVRSRTEALSIRFLGGTANIAAGMGVIARQTGVPVFPCVITRKGWARHLYRVFDPVFPDDTLDKQSDALCITQSVFDVFDHCIRAEPEQWFWFNKRWLFDPLKP
ncbi:MAG: lysophospholipid acyltransferase family protein [Kiritimatiellia bacterium]|nr:hypothetical protein [Lentisphaerota bacterium]